MVYVGFSRYRLKNVASCSRNFSTGWKQYITQKAKPPALLHAGGFASIRSCHASDELNFPASATVTLSNASPAGARQCFTRLVANHASDTASP